MKLTPLILAFVLAGCPKPAPPLDPSDPDATCESACANVREMGCALGKNTPRGATCEAVCKNAAENAIAWSVGCLSGARSCDSAERCR